MTVRFLVIGAGSRGTAYARAVTDATPGVIHAVADPHTYKRRELGRKFIWGENNQPATGQEFTGWKDWLRWEIDRRQKERQPGGSEQQQLAAGVDGVFICTLDETHAEILHALAPLNLHIFCEKPLAPSMSECLSIYRSLISRGPGSGRDPAGVDQPSKIFALGHVLRYSPHNILLRNLLLVDKVIGDIVSLDHCEPVGWWHFAHSYVRGNWRRETANGDGSLLTKSCHDIDFILWLLCSPPPLPPQSSSKAKATAVETYAPHIPCSITSTGSLNQFRRERKPPAAGNATNCLSCPIERECNYSALKIYRDTLFHKADKIEWPLDVVCPDLEDTLVSSGRDEAERTLLARLGEDYARGKTPEKAIAARPWYGRCVYESDNNVCDDQVVTIKWEDDVDVDGDGRVVRRRPGKIATFHMIAPTERQCERRGVVYGTRGELTYDSRSISFYSFDTQSTTHVDVPHQPAEEAKAHGGGDYGLSRAFVAAVDAVENGGWTVQDAQIRLAGCTLEEVIRSHAVVFAAEEARREEKVVRWEDWWKKQQGLSGTIPV